jgi:hypothetical protein
MQIMKKSLSDLNKLYPELLANIYCDCQDGWYDIISDLTKKINDICKRDGLNIHVTQIKEKFGGLCYYLSGYTDEILELIEQAEEESLFSCELCGAPGCNKVTNSFWQTRCEKCS